jgi:hypothetical protein
MSNTKQWTKGPVTFEFDSTTVLYREEYSAVLGKAAPSLAVMVLDAYRYQREWTLKMIPGGSDERHAVWESHAYRHAGVRCIQRVPEKVALAVIAKFLELCEKYPSLPFNAAGENGRPRAEGFVHFHEALLQSVEVTVKLLDETC